MREIAEINPRHPKGLDDAIPISFARMAVLSESKPEFGSLEERPLGEIRKGFTHFAEGDVLFAKITPCMENGKGAVARGLRNKLGCGTTELHVVRPLADITPEYIYRFLAQDRVRRAAKENFTGTAGQARVPTSFIEELELPLAPLVEQRRIVAKLETLLCKVNASQQRLGKIPILLKRFRQSVLAAACSGRLTADWREENQEVESAECLTEQINEVRHKAAKPHKVELLAEDEWPDDTVSAMWFWVRFGSVIGELRNGVPLRPNIDPPGVPILRISAARPGAVNLDDFRYMPDAKQFVPQFTLRDNDLIFTRYNGTIEFLGTCGMVRGLGKKTLLYPDKLMRVRFDHDSILPAYAEVFFQAPHVHERVVANPSPVQDRMEFQAATSRANHLRYLHSPSNRKSCGEWRDCLRWQTSLRCG